MANKIEEVGEDVSRYFDNAVAELGQQDYREVLENFIADLQSRLDCVNEELAAEGMD